MKKALSLLIAIMLVISAVPSVAEGGVSLMASVGTPVIRTAEVINGISISMSCSTNGASIYYTLDGSTPSENSNAYSGQFIIEQAGNYKIRAAAYKNGSESSIASSDFTLLTCGYTPADKDYSKIISISYVSEGTHKGEYAVNFNIPSGYRVYYSTGNTERPSVSSRNAATDQLYIKKPTYINILACRNGYAPERFSLRASLPSWEGIETVERVEAKLSRSYGKVEVELSTKTPGADIYYKVGVNSIPGDVSAADGIKYTGALSFENANAYVIKAVAVKDGYFESDQFLEKTTVTKAATPIINVSDKDSNGRRTVTVTADSDCDIFYTTDGSDPTPISDRYTGPITYGKSLTFKAIAAKMGCVNSSVARATVSASGGDIAFVEMPSAKAEESVSGVKRITLSCATPDADIYYAITDADETGYVVTANDRLYTEPLVFNQTGTYKLWLRAYKNGVYSEMRSPITINVSVDVGGRPVVSFAVLENGIRAVTLSSDEGNKIYYIISDEQLEEVSIDMATLYTYPITANRPMWINAVAVTPDGTVSEIRYVHASESTFPGGEITPEKVNGNITMTSSVNGGILSAVLDCSDTSADIFYTFDTDPNAVATTADIPYTKGSAIEFTSNGYLHVIAAKPGYTGSDKTFAISVTRQKTAAPVLTASVGSDEKYLVQIESATPGASYYYTIDGSVPTQNSLRSPFGYVPNLPKGITFKAIAVADGFEPSDVSTKVLTEGITPQCSEIISEEINIIGGKALRLASLTDGATIYYTTNGAQPTMNSLVYNDTDKIKITSAGETTVRAIAVKSGYLDSEIFSFTVNVQKLDKPAGGYAQVDDLLIQLTASSVDEYGDPIPNISIYYTLDYDLDKENPAPDPTPETAILYTGRFSVKQTVVVRAIAVKEGYANSDVYMGTMRYESNRVAYPTNRTNLVPGGKQLILECSTEGASIYYNTDGGRSYTLYTQPIECTEPTVKVYCFASKDNMTDSIHVTYTLRSEKAPTPEANVPTNSVVSKGTKITLSADKYVYPVTGTQYDSAIFYTLDGSAPTRNSIPYTKPIEVTGETLIRAVAISTGAIESNVLELYYSVDSQQETGISIDVSKLERVNNVVRGSVELTVKGVDCTGRRVMAAIYRGNEMLQVISTDSAVDNTIELSGFDVLLEGNESVLVKAFVLDSDNISPMCKNTMAVF